VAIIVMAAAAIGWGDPKTFYFFVNETVIKVLFRPPSGP
jgi:hypothetical protein